MVKMVVYNDVPVSKRIGVAKGKLKSPADLDQYNSEIAEMFGWEISIKYSNHPDNVEFTGFEMRY